MLSSKYLKDRICKIKQYLNYILMIISQNIQAILRTFLNLKKNEKLFVQKIINRKKISNKHFNICEVEISLDEIIEYINSEIINFQVMMALQQNFVNTFQMNQLLSFQMFMTSGESLTPWVLLIEQESYLPYIKILQTIYPFHF